MNRAAKVLALVALAVATSGCARRWAGDESARIDEAMAPERWSSTTPGAGGIAVYAAAPLAAPWREGEGYQLRRDRHGSRRLRSADRTPARADDEGSGRVREKRSRAGGHRSVAAKNRR